MSAIGQAELVFSGEFHILVCVPAAWPVFVVESHYELPVCSNEGPCPCSWKPHYMHYVLDKFNK